MRKFFLALLLLLVILFSAAFILVKLASIGEEDNWFNRNYRLSLSAYPWIRQVLGLHYDGDARADYLGRRTREIIVELDQIAGQSLPPAVLEAVSVQMEQVTGKQVSIFPSSEIPMTSASYSQEEIRELVRKNKIYRADSKTAVFYILTLTRSSESQSMIGTTVYEDGAVLFVDAIADQKSRKTKELFVSTILHEFGHQLGLDHNDLKNCLMNPEVELGGRIEVVVTEFCDLELGQIAQVKSSL